MRNKVLGLIFLSMLSFLTSLPSCVSSVLTLSEDDEVAIYAAVIRQLYTRDHTFGDELPNFPIVYLRTTDASGVFNPNTFFQAEPRLLPRPVQTAMVTALDDLPAEFVWVEDLDEVPVDRATGGVEGGGAIITLGKENPQKDGSVHVVANLYFTSTGGAGMTYIVERVDGIWQITGYTGERWIS